MSVRTDLMPVRCVDCKNEVPFGWIDVLSAPKCPESEKEGRRPWGHRIPREQYETLIARRAADEEASTKRLLANLDDDQQVLVTIFEGQGAEIAFRSHSFETWGPPTNMEDV